VPKFLWEQFSRVANLYFLVISVIQVSSAELAPTGQYYTALPLLLILSLTALKEIYEDLRRHRQDHRLNRSPARRLPTSPYSPYSPSPRAPLPLCWEDLCVGDLVLVKEKEAFPADLLLLASSDPDLLCYVETSNLDGETNLKSKNGLPFPPPLPPSSLFD